MISCFQYFLFSSWFYYEIRKRLMTSPWVIWKIKAYWKLRYGEYTTLDLSRENRRVSRSLVCIRANVERKTVFTLFCNTVAPWLRPASHNMPVYQKLPKVTDGLRSGLRLDANILQGNYKGISLWLQLVIKVWITGNNNGPYFTSL